MQDTPEYLGDLTEKKRNASETSSQQTGRGAENWSEADVRRAESPGDASEGHGAAPAPESARHRD